MTLFDSAGRFVLSEPGRSAAHFNLAFPGATDLSFPQLAEVMTTRLLNNVGDPWQGGHGPNHTKQAEIDVVRCLGALFGGGNDVWGYVTSGASEGTLHAVDEAATAHPDLVVYASTAAHYSVAKAARIVRAPLARVGVDHDGRMMLDDLRSTLQEHRDKAAMIVATVGTTEREAVDDVPGIASLCDDLGIVRRRIHVDAALAGLPLALLPLRERPAFDFGAGATSVVVSGHKFLSTLMPCAVLIYPRRPALQDQRPVSYIGAADTTIAGSRSGHTPLLLRAALFDHGWGVHRERARQARELAAYTAEALHRIGWPADRLPLAFTVTLRQPGPLPRPWVFGGDAQVGRIICMPGTEQAWIDEVVADLKTAAP
ncbi:histidine decarboxylase [Actinoplanes lutulentus]|uniref:Histidine decarboxylase n=1 Tax=Actinoplanes lutulentus TaxID=1287878 RepID=A0A327ZNQ6_9ACTN|nr:pyridoxal-dependent decarboxylase [Actinoplanes lutulentus]MBB2940623.1 histidine decarboxylase [Actinoplanes lutulentus]RAK42934.1 histidine decarboxylase [Actinoplanes lutulentus]